MLVPTATAVHIWVVWTIHGWQDQIRDLMGVPRLTWYNYPQAAR